MHIRRDPRTLYMALAMPVVMLLLFGFGLSFDIEHIPLAVLDSDRSESSRALARRIFGSHEFEFAGDVDSREGSPTALPSANRRGRVWEPCQGSHINETAEQALRRSQAAAVLVVPAGYERELLAERTSPVQLLVDGSDGNLARQMLSKIDAIVGSASLGRSGIAEIAPLSVKVTTLFNPTGRSTFFLVPGLAAYLLAIAAVLLTALTVAGEWERGSMEQLFASPVGRLEIVLGKLLPYLVLGMVQLLLVLTLATTVFEVPIRGSLGMIFFAGFLFLAGMLGQGLLISVIARNQLVATQAGALSSLLPSLILSGMIVPIENMPRILQALTTVIPARYLVHALRTLMLKGGGLSVVAVDLFALLAFAVVVLALATLRFKRRLA
jgi:ABC-2 type transport system permease protein